MRAEAEITWRNNELTATLSSKKKEILFEVEIPEYEVPPLPPVAIPIPPVESTARETRISNGKE
jgi:hypothetical protein